MHGTETMHQGEGISRRTFLRGLAAAGASIAFLSSGARFVQAQAQAFAASGLSDQQLLNFYDRMLTIRWFERTLADRIVLGQTRGFYGHLYAGEEAVAVGVMGALNQDDPILSTHRAHGHAIAKGVQLDALAAEIQFKATGLNGGYGGTMHVADPSVGFLGADGIVGTGAVLGAGVAYALKVRGQGQVAVTFGGDGHYAAPTFHVALNEAAVNKLPFIYVIETNQYLQYTHYRYTTVLDDVASAAAQYRVPGVVVDGQDVLAVYNAARTAVERARAGEGPSLIEAKTYRYYSHSGAAGARAGALGSFGPDPALINVQRPEREIRHWMAKDPTTLFRRTLLELGILDEAGADQREQQIQASVAAAFDFADRSPAPRPEDALKHVLASGEVAARQFITA